MRSAYIKVHLMDVRQIGMRCGYGEGETLALAVANALKKAHEIDKNAEYNEQSRCVEFDGGTVYI